MQIDKAKWLVEALCEVSMTIATAESCTGGKISAMITAVPGSSTVFPGGVVSYCDRTKHQLLGVPEDLLIDQGAVSEPVAISMAEGISRALGTDIGISATGLAGPDGDGSDTPIGTVFLGLHTPDGNCCRHCSLEGNRWSVQNQAVEIALDMLIEYLETHRHLL